MYFSGVTISSATADTPFAYESIRTVKTALSKLSGGGFGQKGPFRSAYSEPPSMQKRTTVAG